MKSKNSQLLELIQSQQLEIKKHKWIESQKAGKDIGWEAAATDWMCRHFPKWKKHQWEKAVQAADKAAPLAA
jgi:hypothetical protein